MQDFIRGKLFYIKLFLLFVGISLILIFFYTARLHDVIERNTLLTIHETALHDQQAIQTCLEFYLNDLAGVEKRLELADCKKIRELQIKLNMEVASTPFTRLFMVARDGRIYTDRYVIHTPEAGQLGGRFNFRNLFEGTDSDRLVVRFDDNAEFAGISRESILYAIRLKSFRVENIDMAALIGFTDISFLQNHMIINGFMQGGVSYGISSVIDAAGDFIFGKTKDVYLDNDTNFFSDLAQATECSLTNEEIMNRMRQQQSFSFKVKTKAGEELCYLLPFRTRDMSQPDWYFLMIVNNDFMKERQATFFILSLSLLGMVVLVLALLMFYGVLSHNRLHIANQAVKVRGEFLSSMSHEIRTPLNGIIGLNHLITSHIDEPARLPQIKDWLLKSRSMADYLLSLLNDILDMSKLQASKLTLSDETFSLADMMADVIFMQSANAEKRGLTLELAMNITQPFIHGDLVRLKQVLTNIISNAIKFTEPGGRIEVSVTQRDIANNVAQTVFRCKDTGIGMSPEFLRRIFDPFVQDNSAQTRAAFRGTGLGMPICKEIVDAMGGQIEVRSKPEEGSEFMVTVPVRLATDAEIQESENRNEVLSPARNPDAHLSGKILLAEDVEFNAEFLIELLEEEGFSVVHAKNGQEAVDIFSQSEPGEFFVILMDMQMPVMDGCEATATIRKLDRPDAASVIIYACTANTFSEDRDRALRSGMNDFLIKPIDIKMFLKKINALNAGGHKSGKGGAG